jgi:hypothetical protein
MCEERTKVVRYSVYVCRADELDGGTYVVYSSVESLIFESASDRLACRGVTNNKSSVFSLDVMVGAINAWPTTKSQSTKTVVVPMRQTFDQSDVEISTSRMTTTSTPAVTYKESNEWWLHLTGTRGRHHVTEPFRVFSIYVPHNSRVKIPDRGRPKISKCVISGSCMTTAAAAVKHPSSVVKNNALNGDSFQASGTAINIQRQWLNARGPGYWPRPWTIPWHTTITSRR